MTADPDHASGEDYLEDYRRDGIAVVRRVFGPAEVAALATAFDRQYAAGLAHPHFLAEMDAVAVVPE